jgi:hypothetical protein
MAVDELQTSLKENISQLLFTKARLPVLKALAIELKRIGNGVDPPSRNGCVLQLVRDSFDMMVIDLASLREGMTASRGTLNMLRQNLHRIKRFTPEDCEPDPIAFTNAEPDEQEKLHFRQMLSIRMSDQWNAVFERLFPGVVRVTDDEITKLIAKFRADTEAIYSDRNRVRAHRFEEAARNAARFFQPLAQVEVQFGVFERYLKDLYFVLEPGTSYLMDVPRLADPDKTADDLADLMTLGSIDQSTIRYGLVAETGHYDSEPPWYWFRRQQFFEAKDKSQM